MFAYTSKADVAELLPANLPAAITDADYTSWITRASKEVDIGVGREYPVRADLGGQKFEDQPDTPHVVKLVATWLAASWGFARIKEVNRAPNQMSGEEKYRKWAEMKLEAVRSGEIDVYDGAGEDVGTAAVAPLAVAGRDAVFTADVLGRF